MWEGAEFSAAGGTAWGSRRSRAERRAPATSNSGERPGTCGVLRAGLRTGEAFPWWGSRSAPRPLSVTPHPMDAKEAPLACWPLYHQDPEALGCQSQDTDSDSMPDSAFPGTPAPRAEAQEVD